MHKFLISLLFVLIFSGCSEGDIIESSIDFTADLKNCSNTNESTFVFYKIGTKINQSLSFNFKSTTFSLQTAEDTPIEIELNSTTNVLTYRELNSSINGSEYFCASVPPSNITVTKELISTNGSALIEYTLQEETVTEKKYLRTIILNNITLEGNNISYRVEYMELGSDQVIVLK